MAQVFRPYGTGRPRRPDCLGCRLLREERSWPVRLPLLGFVSKISPSSTSVVCVHSRLATVPARGVSSELDRRRGWLSPYLTPRLRYEPSAPECQSGTRSALAVSHGFDGLLRTQGAGLFHPATDHGVRLVADPPGCRSGRADSPNRGSSKRHRPYRAPQRPPSLEVREGNTRRRSERLELSRTHRPRSRPEGRLPDSGVWVALCRSRANPCRGGLPLPSLSRAILTGADTLRSFPLNHSRIASPRPASLSTLPALALFRPPGPTVLRAFLRVRVRCARVR